MLIILGESRSAAQKSDLMDLKTIWIMEVTKASLLNVTWQGALHTQSQYLLDKFTQHHITCAYTYSCFTASNLWGHWDLKKSQNIKRDTRVLVRKGNKMEHDFKLYHSMWHSDGRREWDKLREQYGNIHITMWKTDSKWELAVTQRAQPSVLWQPEGWDGMGGGTGGSGGRGHMCSCGWFMVMCGRGQHNIVKKFSFNKLRKSIESRSNKDH